MAILISKTALISGTESKGNRNTDARTIARDPTVGPAGDGGDIRT